MGGNEAEDNDQENVQQIAGILLSSYSRKLPRAVGIG